MSTAIISVPAGATVTTEWHHTLDGAVAGDTADPIDASHKGPVIAYLFVEQRTSHTQTAYSLNQFSSAKVTNATQTSVTGLKWFKIYQDGLTASDQKWGVDRLIANKGKVTFKIPSCIAAGQYLLRHEIIGQ